MKNKKEKIVMAYVPVLHEGYKRFFDEHKDKDVWYVFGTDVIKKFDYLRKEIRALEPKQIKKALESWFPKQKIYILDESELKDLIKKEVSIFAPNEDVVKEFLDDNFPKSVVEYNPLFLRWNRENVEKKYPVHEEGVIAAGDMENEMFGIAITEAKNVSDWWLQVGAVITKDGEVVLSGRNRYLQSVHAVWSDGDPRNVFFRGVEIDLTTSLHAERGLIAEAARQGISLEGASMYVTDFPCPTCAHMIAKSGIKKIYHLSGYGMLDGVEVLKGDGVKIIRVTGIERPKGKDFLKYPEKSSGI